MNWLVFSVIFVLFLLGIKKSSASGSSWLATAIAAAGLTMLFMVVTYVGFKLVIWLFWPLVILAGIIGLFMLVWPEKKKS